MFKFFTVMILGKLVKIFSYLCIALFGIMDGNMVPLNNASLAGLP
jgi:hypothetical protein